jgi:predicted Zn finger-like uncharacterized protein
MIAACPQCGARYRIERERLPAQGARLRCSRCEAVFRVNAPPVERAVEPPSEARAVESPLATESGPRAEAPRPLVLVADPDIESGKRLAGMLSAWGVDPVLVHDGVEAILSVQRTLPSLVVLEASLPKMFGFQVCELMKRNEQLRAIPVVLVGSIHLRERYRRQPVETYGADAYLERPELAESLRALLRQRGILALAEPPGVAPAPAATPRPEPPPAAAPVKSVARAPEPPPAHESRRDEEPPAAPTRPAPTAPPPSPDPELSADVARAERLARIIVSDIVLYNPERFEAALRSGDVVEAMATEMEEGRTHFRERIAERIRERRDFLGEELRRVAKLRGNT